MEGRWKERGRKLDLLDATDLYPGDFWPGSGSSCSVSDSHSASAWDAFDGWSGLDVDEWLGLLVLLLAVLVATVAAVLVIDSAPALLSEALLDGVLATALRGKMIRITEQHWTRGIFRRTAGSFLVVALVFSAAGGIMHQLRPEATSIGGIWHAERVSP